MTTNQPGSLTTLKSESIRGIDNWIAYDFEWTVKNHDKSRLV